MPNHKIFNERPECQDRLIKVLEKMGYTYVSRSEAEAKRGFLSRVLFEDELIKFLKSQSYNFKGHEYPFSGESIGKAVNALDASLLQGLMIASKEVYNLLTLGISLEESIAIDREMPVKQSFDLNYIDFENLEKNIWQVTEEFSVERSNGSYARPDVVLLINGIPIAVIECKKSSIDVIEGVLQNVRNMKPDYIPTVFKYSQLVISMNPNKVLYGTAGTPADHFVEWRDENKEWQKEIVEKCSPDGQILEQDRIAASLLDRRRLLDLTKYYILYDSNIKKIARHQQYFAIEKTMNRIEGRDQSDSNGGVIWHTQGSGKSLTMVMLVKKIQMDKGLENPRFIIISDRVNLDKQIRDNFLNTQMTPVRAGSGKGLKRLLEDRNNLVITTLINKFQTVCKNRYLEVDSDKFYVLMDEAHRSQYSSMYNYMYEVLPNSTFVAFTGTPLISKAKKNTYKKFGAPIHNYTMKMSIEDKITVPLVYEGRKVKQNDPSDTIDAYFENLTHNLPENQKRELKQKFSRFSKLAEASSRVSLIALDIHDHFVNYAIPKGLKAMVVCSSRGAAVEMYNVLSKLPGICPKVVITFGDKREGDDDENTNEAIKKIAEYHEKFVSPYFGDSDEKYDEYVTDDFKNPEGEINILIVKDKLLTGFDAPVAGVLYLDKSVKEHSLLQAIARVNRVYKDKDFGLIVDYWGVFTKLNTALDMYEDAESELNRFDSSDMADALFGTIDEKNKLETAHRLLWELFDGIEKNASSENWQKYLEDDNKRNDFYEKLKSFANILNLAITNREIFVCIGYDLIEKYKSDYIFFNKLRRSVVQRYDGEIDSAKYESGIKNLIDTFVNAEDVKIIVPPVSIGDEIAMNKMLAETESHETRGDIIKTKVEAALSGVRYDDPLQFQNFSMKIRETIVEYDASRDADSYYANMEQIAEDFRSGNTFREYPAILLNDADGKAIYGSIIIALGRSEILANLETEEIIAKYAVKIKSMMFQMTKRDWKHNEIAHKNIHSCLDDYLFEMFDEMDIVIDDTNVGMLDIIVDEVMRVAVAKF
ncbi:MAG: type I restriction endonuclease subunit R [Anaerovoracaceae bacterium]